MVLMLIMRQVFNTYHHEVVDVYEYYSTLLPTIRQISLSMHSVDFVRYVIFFYEYL